MELPLQKQPFFPISRIKFRDVQYFLCCSLKKRKVAFPMRQQKIGRWDGQGVVFSTRVLGGFVFCTPFSSNDVCNAVAPLTRVRVDTQNLATSHLSTWKTYQKIQHSLRHVLSITNDQTGFLGFWVKNLS